MENALSGSEKFTINGLDAKIAISDFWSWAYSDIINNTYRGVLAEFIVFSSMFDISRPYSQVRADWLPYDITSPSGKRIEVKSASYLQSWTKDFYSKIMFDIAPKHIWSPDEGYSLKRKRNCDLYVFCVYTALTTDKSPLDLDLWDFYVLPASVLNDRVPEQKTIGLQSLLKLKPVKTSYSSLCKTIEESKL